MVKEDSDLEPDEKSRRIAALKGSLGRLMLITPELCQSYLKAWAHDRRQWESHINRLPTGLRIPEALARLTQDGSSPLRYKLSDEMPGPLPTPAFRRAVRPCLRCDHTRWPPQRPSRRPSLPTRSPRGVG